MSQSSLGLVNFRIGTVDTYTSAVKDPNTLYFLTDVHKIMKGEDDYTSDIFIVDKLPKKPIPDKVYVVGKRASMYKRVQGGYSWVDLYNLETVEERVNLLDSKVDDINVRDKHLSFNSVAEADSAINADGAKGIFAGKRITIKENGLYVSYIVQPADNGKFNILPMSTEGGNTPLLWYDIG